MRGERDTARTPAAQESGSSPHARGTLAESLDNAQLHRFIPACAGNAPTHLLELIMKEVHPRMRGERRCGPSTNEGPNGSSPHARGTPKHAPREPVPARFIPACAGNAEPPPGVPREAPVHPRMRGERVAFHSGGGLAHGSSPHARGTPCHAAAAQLLPRFIPACAGNAESPRWQQPG